MLAKFNGVKPEVAAGVPVNETSRRAFAEAYQAARARLERQYNLMGPCFAHPPNWRLNIRIDTEVDRNIASKKVAAFMESVCERVRGHGAPWAQERLLWAAHCELRPGRSDWRYRAYFRAGSGVRLRQAIEECGAAWLRDDDRINLSRVTMNGETAFALLDDSALDLVYIAPVH